jgi:hypothetical protein
VSLTVFVLTPDAPKEPLGLGWLADAPRWRP